MRIIDQLWHGFETWALGWGGLLGLIGLCLLLLWFFTPSWISNSPAKALLLNVGIGCLAFSLISAYYIKVGFQNCIDTVTAADRASVARKNEALKDLARCGVENWDVTKGICENQRQTNSP